MGCLPWATAKGGFLFADDRLAGEAAIHSKGGRLWPLMVWGTVVLIGCLGVGAYTVGRTGPAHVCGARTSYSVCLWWGWGPVLRGHSEHLNVPEPRAHQAHPGAVTVT